MRYMASPSRSRERSFKIFASYSSIPVPRILPLFLNKIHFAISLSPPALITESYASHKTSSRYCLYFPYTSIPCSDPTFGMAKRCSEELCKIVILLPQRYCRYIAARITLSPYRCPLLHSDESHRTASLPAAVRLTLPLDTVSTAASSPSVKYFFCSASLSTSA